MKRSEHTVAQKSQDNIYQVIDERKNHMTAKLADKKISSFVDKKNLAIKLRKGELDDDEEDEDEGELSGGYRCYNTGDGSDETFKFECFGHTLTLQQLPSDQNIGHGAVVWEAAVIFAKYMEYSNNKDLSVAALSGKTVLELGSGTGLGGLCMCLRGAVVTLTDLPEVVSALTFRNTKAVFNQLRSLGAGATAAPLLCPSVYPADWTDECNISKVVAFARTVNDPRLNAQGQLSDAAASEHFAECTSSSLAEASLPLCPAVRLPYDIVLLTDCVFSAALVPHLIRTILAATGPRSVVYCVHEIRDVEANDAFLVALSEHFKYKSVLTKDQHPEYRHEQVQIIIAKPLRFTRK